MPWLGYTRRPSKQVALAKLASRYPLIQSIVLGLALLAPPILGGPLLDLPVDPGALSPDARSAWLDVLTVAPAAEHWVEKWNRAEPREQVVATLSKSLKSLTAAAEKPMASLDVLLAAGITGRLAHNLDIPGAAEAGLNVGLLRDGTPPLQKHSPLGSASA